MFIMATQPNTDDTIRIPAHRVDELLAKVERLARRAFKLGMRAPTVERLGVETEKTKCGVRVYERVRLQGTAPVIAGWRFVARVEHTAAGNIVAKALGCEEENLVAYRDAASVCEHCGTTRRRNDTFVLVDEQGTRKQVGRNCLKDFVGSSDVSVAIALWTLMAEFRSAAGEGEEGGSWGGPSWPSTKTYVANAFACVRAEGWRSRQEMRNFGGGTCTADDAAFACQARPTNAYEAERWETLQAKDSDVERATAALAWVADPATDCTSDYMHNLRVACAQGFVDYKHQGIVASIVQAFARHEQREVERKRRAQSDANKLHEHFGEQGKRYDLVLVVTAVRYMEGNYGTTTLVSFEDDAGRSFKWFASGGREFKVGERVQVRGTVKRHAEYKGRPETHLSRCNVAETSA